MFTLKDLVSIDAPVSDNSKPGELVLRRFIFLCQFCKFCKLDTCHLIDLFIHTLFHKEWRCRFSLFICRQKIFVLRWHHQLVSVIEETCAFLRTDQILCKSIWISSCGSLLNELYSYETSFSNWDGLVVLCFLKREHFLIGFLQELCHVLCNVNTFHRGLSPIAILELRTVSQGCKVLVVRVLHIFLSRYLTLTELLYDHTSESSLTIGGLLSDLVVICMVFTFTVIDSFG